MDDVVVHADDATDGDMAHHRAAFAPVTDCPLRAGNRVTLLPGGMVVLRAMWAAMRAARRGIVLEFYELENIAVDGTTLEALLLERLGAGIRVAIIYDGVGSDGTPNGFFDALSRAGAAVMPFRALNPARRFFSLRVNDRDHRKILVVDDRVAFLGGVNLGREYLNPRANGVPPDGNTKEAFWEDASARFEGPSVGDALALFRHTWTRHGGDPLPPFAAGADGSAPEGTAPGGTALVCVEGSAPREGRPLHVRALAAALGAARRHVWIASGYFVPTAAELRDMTAAARRGIDVRLVLPGVSDVPVVVRAARATYGSLLGAGVRIHELHGAVLHAKASTVDGVWTSIGSSNLDRRSALLNNEVDAVVFDRTTARAMEATMRDWFDAGTEITLDGWRRRSVHERLGELASRGWRRLL